MPLEWALLLFSAAIFFQIIPELFFIDDPIGPPYDRYNTVFKFYYCAWALAALGCSILLARLPMMIGAYGEATSGILKKGPKWEGWAKRLSCYTLFGAVVVFGGLYPIMGIGQQVQQGRSRMTKLISDGMDEKTAFPLCRTLNGLAFMEMPSYAPDDLHLALWMRENVKDASRIAEATGGSYSMVARFATISGIPSFIGWTSHESQWRGDAFSSAYGREPILKQLYSTENADEALRICRENGLKWVVVGSLERDIAKGAALAKFDKMGREVKRFGNSALYEMPVSEKVGK